jgi:drug/metabolite transporter (DMT)-like permease
MVMAFGRIPISEAMVLFYTWPAFTCLLSASVAGEPAGPKEWALVFVAFIGASVILWPQGDISHLNWGHMMALTAALLASLAMILVRRLSRDNNPIAIYFYLCLVGSLVCLVPWLKQGMGDPSELWPDSRLGLTVLAVMALPSVLSHLFVNKGFEVLRASRVGVLMTLELPVLAFFGVFFLQEPLTLRLLFGTFLILLSSMALNLERKGKQVVCDEN